jgi:hypothetical protein
MKNLIRFALSASFTLPGILTAADTSVAQPVHSCSQMENFLLTAHPGFTRSVSAGVTGTHKMTLDDGSMRHDAHLQTIDEKKTSFQGTSGTNELNFRDSYKYNIAAYELAKLLNLNMVPPYVERSVGGSRGSLSWWIDNAMMEVERYKKNITVPDPENWNQQMYVVRVFHELVYDTDPNLTNLLITKDWQLWIIDLTRAFRLNENIHEPKNLVQCDRKLLERLRQIDQKMLKEKLSRWLTNGEIHALDVRRAKIVRFFDDAVKTKGETAVLFDFTRTDQPCGLGL